MKVVGNNIIFNTGELQIGFAHMGDTVELFVSAPSRKRPWRLIFSSTKVVVLDEEEK